MTRASRQGTQPRSPSYMRARMHACVHVYVHACGHAGMHQCGRAGGWEGRQAAGRLHVRLVGLMRVCELSADFNTAVMDHFRPFTRLAKKRKLENGSLLFLATFLTFLLATFLGRKWLPSRPTSESRRVDVLLQKLLLSYFWQQILARFFVVAVKNNPTET